MLLCTAQFIIGDGIDIHVPVWYMDIDTTAKYKSGVTTVKDSVRLDPWVFMFSAGYRF